MSFPQLTRRGWYPHRFAYGYGYDAFNYKYHHDWPFEDPSVVGADVGECRDCEWNREYFPCLTQAHDDWRSFTQYNESSGGIKRYDENGLVWTHRYYNEYYENQYTQEFTPEVLDWRILDNGNIGFLGQPHYNYYFGGTPYWWTNWIFQYNPNFFGIPPVVGRYFITQLAVLGFEDGVMLHRTNATRTPDGPFEYTNEPGGWFIGGKVTNDSIRTVSMIAPSQDWANDPNDLFFPIWLITTLKQDGTVTKTEIPSEYIHFHTKIYTALEYPKLESHGEHDHGRHQEAAPFYAYSPQCYFVGGTDDGDLFVFVNYQSGADGMRPGSRLIHFGPNDNIVSISTPTDTHITHSFLPQIAHSVGYQHGWVPLPWGMCGDTIFSVIAGTGIYCYASAPSDGQEAYDNYTPINKPALCGGMKYVNGKYYYPGSIMAPVSGTGIHNPEETEEGYVTWIDRSKWLRGHTFCAGAFDIGPLGSDGFGQYYPSSTPAKRSNFVGSGGYPWVRAGAYEWNFPSPTIDIHPSTGQVITRRQGDIAMYDHNGVLERRFNPQFPCDTRHGPQNWRPSDWQLYTTGEGDCAVLLCPNE